MATMEDVKRKIVNETINAYNKGYLEGYICGRKGINEAMEDKIADMRYEAMDCQSGEPDEVDYNE